MARTVVFVCPHGALKSRIAAAWFNTLAPPGWRATSAGLTPQEQVSVHAAPLLAGTGAQALLDLDPPKALDGLSDVDRVVGIDCQIPDSVCWQLDNGHPGEAMRDEIGRLVQQLAQEIGDEQ